MENLLEKIEKRPIPKTKYEIDQNGFIYRNGRRLKSHYKNGRWYCNLQKKSGRQLMVDTERLAELIFSDENPPELTRAPPAVRAFRARAVAVAPALVAASTP